jgi:hypothetical protein
LAWVTFNVRGFSAVKLATKLFFGSLKGILEAKWREKKFLINAEV